jgi:hypothetical protein
MNVTEKPVPTSAGVFFIGFALLAAAFVLSGAKAAHSPILYGSLVHLDSRGLACLNLTS